MKEHDIEIDDEQLQENVDDGSSPAHDAAPATEAKKSEPPPDPKPPKLNFDAAGEKKTAEQWAEIKATPAWLFAATRAGLQWPRGQEMTEADFDVGVKWAATAPCR